MPRVRFVEVALSLRVTLAEAQLAAHVATPPATVGEALALQVQAYVQGQKLGYYPALDYFRAHTGAVDPVLLDYAEEVGRLATRLVRDEVLRKLRPVFANLRFDALHSLAFAMPTVRPARPDSLGLLAAHYTPTQVKADLYATLVQKGEPKEGMDRYARQLVGRWLQPSFERLELTAAQQVSQGTAD